MKFFGNTSSAAEAVDDGVLITKKIKGTSSVGGLAGMALRAARASNGDHFIPYSAISSIYINAGGFMSSAFIQFLSAGERSTPSAKEAASDPNCILFDKTQIREAEKFKSFVESKCRDAKIPATSGGTSSLADEIRKLTELKDAGALTENEYKIMKARLIN